MLGFGPLGSTPVGASAGEGEGTSPLAGLASITLTASADATARGMLAGLGLIALTASSEATPTGLRPARGRLEIVLAARSGELRDSRVVTVFYARTRLASMR